MPASAAARVNYIEMADRPRRSSAGDGLDSAPTSGRSTPTGQRKEDDPLLDVEESVVYADGEDKASPFVWFLVTTAAISGLLFGYDTGVISGTLVNISTDLGGRLLTSTQKEIITSATTLGALIGGLASGVTSDYLGRKWVIAVASAIFIVGALIQGVSKTVAVMVVGRLVIGLGVGVASCVAPLYIGELSPTRIRGRLVTINVVFVTLGQVIAYAIGAAFEHVSHGWRWMVGLGAVPAAVQLVCVAFLPESPRILLRRGDTAAARSTLERVYPLASSAQIKLKMEIMQASVEAIREIDRRTTFWQRVRSIVTIGTYRRALIIGAGLQAFQQLCGFNTLMYYAATLFKNIGFNNPTAVGLIIAGTNFVFTGVALRIVDPVGRRRIMIWTAPGMALALAMAAVFFHFLTKDTGGRLIEGSTYSSTWSGLVLMAMILYVASYATGIGNIAWQQGELFKLDVRGIGTSLCTATNWSMNLLISSTFLSLMDAATPSGAFGLYAGLCVLGWLFCVFCYPETSGLSLEEVYYIFEHDFGIQRSQDLRADKERQRLDAVAARNEADPQDHQV